MLLATPPASTTTPALTASLAPVMVMVIVCGVRSTQNL